jgi:chorismate-pyruvate lyase
MLNEAWGQLNAIHRILMTTDGSITGIIEAITQKEVKVETVDQRIISADGKITELLNVNYGEKVNFRVVYLKVENEIFAKAISYTPLSRLEQRFRDDLMRADIPIGKIMKKHGIEARREMNWRKITRADSKLAGELDIKEGSLVLIRNYNIIHRGEVLINITEFFPADRYQKFGNSV